MNYIELIIRFGVKKVHFNVKNMPFIDETLFLLGMKPHFASFILA
jgi:hypothetical protein